MKWPAKHFNGLDPDLVGEKAYNHPAVKQWWNWLLNDYKPRAPILLLTPCSNVKPYTRSPMSRKIAGLLRKNGLQGRIEWAYLSDLLILVPHYRAEEYPATSYEVPPDLVIQNKHLREKVTTQLAKTIEVLTAKGLETIVTFLPKKHLAIYQEAKSKARTWPREVITKYTIYSTKHLKEVLELLVQKVDKV